MEIDTLITSNGLIVSSNTWSSSIPSIPISTRLAIDSGDAFNSDSRPTTFKVITQNSSAMKRNLHLTMLLAVFLLSVGVLIEETGASSASPETVRQLKMSLNQLVRQQNAQLAHYKSQLEASTRAELREAVFALSEVMQQCTLAWRGLQAQFLAVDASCANNAPNTPQSMASETASDLNQCLAEVQENVAAVTRPIDESMSAEIVKSSKLNFWLQSKLFATASSSVSSGGAFTLDTFDATAAARDIFNEAVLWDNVDSFRLYHSVRAAPPALTSAGEWGFVCGLTSYNKLFQKMKNTEAFLNTNCAASGSVNAADAAGQTPPSRIGDDHGPRINSTQPEVTVKLVAGL